VSGLSFLAVAAIVTAAILINGLIATLEDDMPGGFNNPDGANTPRYALMLSSASKPLFTLFSLGASAVFVFLAYVASDTRQGVFFTSFAVATVLVYLAVAHRFRWALWGSVACMVAPILYVWLEHAG
jgi:hypothetical protein